MTYEDVTITVLVDNEASDGFAGEHGLSLWIDVGPRRILFDTGQGPALLPNVRRLGVPLEQTETVVISHGHYDHTGGLDSVLARASRARLVIHPQATVTRYSVRPPKAARSIGMPDRVRIRVGQLPAAQVTNSTGPVMLAPHIGVTGPVARDTSFEDVGGPFFLDERGQKPDPIVDDQALWIATPAGLVICAGCCHSGLINTLRHIQNVSGVSRIRAVIGGFHLVNADANRLLRTVDALHQIKPEHLVPCHCTGRGAIDVLREAFGDAVRQCRCGSVFRFEIE